MSSLGKIFRFDTKSIKFTALYVFVCQSILPLKIIALLLIQWTSKGLRSGLNEAASKFYIVVTIYTLLNGLFYTGEGLKYILALILSTFFWIFSLLIFLSLFQLINRLNFDQLMRIVKGILYANTILTIVQYLLFCIKMNHPFPYMIHSATGDYLMGFWGNANVNMIYYACSGLFFIQLHQRKLAIMSLLICVLTTFNGGILILGLAIIIYFFTNRSASIKLRFTMFAVIIVVITVFYFVAYRNISYMLGFLERSTVLNQFTPLKIISTIDTINNWTQSTSIFLFGEGPANYSSRVAFLVSGHYVDWWPSSLTYISDSFNDGNLYLWLYKANNPFTDVKSFANQPNNVYAQFIGEYGLIGVILLFYYLHYWYRNTFNIGRLMFMFFVGILFTDYWFEFLNVVPFFEFYFLLMKKKTA